MTEKIQLRMSASGKCPRALSAELLGYSGAEPPSWLELAAIEGNWHEDRIIYELEHEFGMSIYKRQEEYIIKSDNFDLMGHIDGIVYPTDYEGNENLDKLLEVKSMSQYEFDRWAKGSMFDGFFNYACQISCYMEATKLPALYIVKNRNSGTKFTYTLTEKPVAMELIIDKLNSVVEAYRENQLAPAEFNSNSIECKRCGYSKLCLPEPEVLDDITQEVLNNACRDWRTGVKLEEQGKILQGEAKKVFWAYNVELPKWKYNGLTITKYTTTRKSYDAKVLEATFEPVQLLPALKESSSESMRIIDTQKDKESNGN